jgi:glycosyltransferase involved in cell wall biosynthesis
MRVCIVYDCLFPHTVGGAERWYRNLAERLAAAGHEVDYMTLRQWPAGERPDMDPRVRVVQAGPRMALYTQDGRRRILPPLVFGAGVLARLLMRGRRYDVVHCASFPFFSLLAAGALRPLLRYRLVVDWFEVWSEQYWREYLGPAGGRVGGLVQRLCALIPQRAFCFSELHAARLRGLGLRGEVRILRGLHRPAEHLAPDRAPLEPDPVVVFAGRLIPEKQVTLAVDAIGLAIERERALRGVVFGDGPERAALEEAIARDGRADAISAPGFAATEVVEQTLRRAACMLLTSRREGYGMVVVEASSHGTPSVVVAGPDNAATELIEEGVNGLIAAPRAAAIADAIARVRAAGMDMRRSTSDWYARNAERLSLESSLAIVLESYDSNGR